VTITQCLNSKKSVTITRDVQTKPIQNKIVNQSKKIENCRKKIKHFWISGCCFVKTAYIILNFISHFLHKTGRKKKNFFYSLLVLYTLLIYCLLAFNLIYIYYINLIYIFTLHIYLI